MKLCLLLHCLCRSYQEIPEFGRDLFVSLEDLEDLVKQLSYRGFQFTALDDPKPDTVTITFDDGYYNNVLFQELANAYNIPYLILVSAYYAASGDCFPWLLGNGKHYNEMHKFDYYRRYHELESYQKSAASSEQIRPFNFQELQVLANEKLVEIGCHGYYHQALSNRFERYLPDERDRSMTTLQENLNIATPRYFGLANGIYTRHVVRELLRTYERVLTSDGKPYRANSRIVHRLNLINPNLGGPLIQQIDRHLQMPRQIKRTIRIGRKLWL